MICLIPQQQRGTTLVVGLIMLLMISLLVITNLNMSTSNLNAVSNMQFRNEALAAANKATAQVLSSSFATSPTAETINVDIDNNGVTDYVVSIAQPQCIRASRAYTAGGNTTVGIIVAGGDTWNTVWDIDATVSSSSANAGEASIRVHSGVRVLLTETQRNSACP